MLRIRIRNELIPLNLFVIILIIVVNLLPANAFRIVLAIPFLLFCPGYILVAVLYPRKGQLASINRIALSFGLSIAIVPLVGLALNYTPWGITPGSALYSLSAFIFVTSFITWYRRRRLPDAEKFNITLQLRLPGWGGSVPERVLSVVLVIAIAGALGVLGYAVASPRIGEKYTEFYTLDEAGQLAEYPRDITLDTGGKVVLGIVNHEYQDVTYHIEVTVSGEIVEIVSPIDLEYGQKWEQEMAFIPVRAGENQEVEFLLFKGEGGQAYRSLHLWINVTEGE